MNRKTNKTAPLLRLLTRNETGVITNPIIDEEFKQGVIYVRTPKVEEPEKPQAVEINIISELIGEWLPQTIKRFNGCDFCVCWAEITVAAINENAPKYVRKFEKTNFYGIMSNNDIKPVC